MPPVYEAERLPADPINVVLASVVRIVATSAPLPPSRVSVPAPARKVTPAVSPLAFTVTLLPAMVAVASTILIPAATAALPRVMLAEDRLNPSPR